MKAGFSLEFLIGLFSLVFVIYLVLGIIAVFKKNGTAKKKFIISIVFFVLSALTLPDTETTTNENNESKSTNEKIEKEEQTEEKEKTKELTKEQIKSQVEVGMTFKDFSNLAQDALNVKLHDYISLGNNVIGIPMQATDGLVLLTSDLKTISEIHEFENLDEAKKYGLEVEAKAKAQAYEDSKIKLSGSGDSATELIKLSSGFAVFEGQHTGSSNFIVKLMDENGNSQDLLVNKIGSYKGKTFANISSSGSYYLEVKAGGNWNFTITQGFPLEMNKVPTSFNGNGDDVVFFEADKGNYKFTFNHSGSSNFIVKLNGSSLMVNKIGQYQGNMRKKLDTDGVYVLVIRADGDWSVTIEE